MTTRLFVHHPLFRLFSPLFGGTLVYLLILLINNSISAVQETFLGQELYVCIGLTYVTQESSRFSLLLFQRLHRPKSFFLRVFLQVISSIALTVLLVSLAMYLYFKYVLLYTPNFRELYIFNSIFSFITVLYVVVYLGHYFLYRRNTQKIEKEAAAKRAIETDFNLFKKGINPALLFESLEAMLVVMKKDPMKAEELSDSFSSIYRYILSKKMREVVPISEEMDVLHELIRLFNHLPFRNVQLGKVAYTTAWIVPTSLLTLVEAIVRTTIASESQAITITIIEENGRVTVQYSPEERLQQKLDLNSIAHLVDSYRFYASESITLHEDGPEKIIQLPKLHYHESSHS